MSIYYQKQPVFTATPILKTKTFDPTIADRNWDHGMTSPTPTVIFDGSAVLTLGSEAGLIERITVTNAMDISAGSNRTSTEKLVWLYIQDINASTWVVYKTGHMPAADLNVAGTVNPEIEWTFTGGLAVNINTKLGIMASANYSTNSYYGDYLSVVVEGGDYTAVL
jgi:hypothetical protein